MPASVVRLKIPAVYDVVKDLRRSATVNLKLV